MGSRPQVIQKARVEWDGTEIPGLVSVSEIPEEMGTVEVPEFDISRTITSGVRKIPPVDMVYQVRRDGQVNDFFTNFYQDHEEHEAVIIYTDAGGIETYRLLAQACECSKLTRPEVDHANPTYAKLTMTFLPYDIKKVSAA